jgi:hypothetical protein
MNITSVVGGVKIDAIRSVAMSTIDTIATKYNFTDTDGNVIEKETIGLFVFETFADATVIESEERAEKPRKLKIKAKKSEPTEPKEKKAPKEKKTVREEIPKITMPWCGVVIEGCCHALVSSYDLYNQCTKDATVGDFCEKHATAHKAGTVEDRMSSEDMYKVNGKKVKRWSEVLKNEKFAARPNIGTQEEVEAEAARLGWTVDPSQFEEPPKGKRGRKPKSAAVSDTESESESPAPKKRGRPKKVEEPKKDMLLEKMKANQTEPEEEVEKVDEEKVDEEKVDEEKVEEEKVVEPEKKVELEEYEPELECESEQEMEVEMWDAPDGNTYYVNTENNYVIDMESEVVLGKRVNGELVEIEDEE